MRHITVVLCPEKNTQKDDEHLFRWVQNARRLRDILAQRANAREMDARLWRKLRYEFAKLKAKR